MSCPVSRLDLSPRPKPIIKYNIRKPKTKYKTQKTYEQLASSLLYRGLRWSPLSVSTAADRVLASMAHLCMHFR